MISKYLQLDWSNFVSQCKFLLWNFLFLPHLSHCTVIGSLPKPTVCYICPIQYEGDRRRPKCLALTKCSDNLAALKRSHGGTLVHSHLLLFPSYIYPFLVPLSHSSHHAFWTTRYLVCKKSFYLLFVILLLKSSYISQLVQFSRTPLGTIVL